MKICPIAIAVGCNKCAVFKVCPVKAYIGDYKAPAAPKAPIVDKPPRPKRS